jgi:hypothetical protein
MAERKNITKKLRFEVFKRDSFTCQYCGQKAPDVVLEIDHINPVSKGGTDNILNLVTSCFDCNRGKGKRSLKKNETLESQRKQMELLNVKREQLEMLNEWHHELLELEERQISIFEDIFGQLTESVITLTSGGRKHLIREIRKYGFNEIIESLKISFNQYSDVYDTDTVFEYVFRIANVRHKNKRGDEDGDI